MTKPDFKSAAVAFVRRHNCHQSTPVELVMAAMEEGATMQAASTNELLADSLKSFKIDREASNGHPDSKIYEPKGQFPT